MAPPTSTSPPMPAGPRPSSGGHRPELCVVGDFAWDVLIRTDAPLLAGGDTFGEVALLPGGSAANVAVWASRCGLTSHFVGKIGRDRLGRLARENLESEAVEAHLVESDAHLTGSVAVLVDHTGERSMVSGRGADFHLLPSELPRSVLRRVDHLHLTAWSLFTDPPRDAARQAARIARSGGATLSLDPASFQMLREMGVETFLSATRDLDIDLLLPNREEGTTLTGETEPTAMADALSELYPTALIVLKLDADGALVLLDDVSHHIPPATDDLVDATGAGDAFAGAFIAHHLEHGSPVEAARFATMVAAWVIGHRGARPDGDRRLDTILSGLTPVDAASAGPTSGPPVSPEKSDVPARRRVLVVDDEEILRSMATDILEEFGYEPSLAPTGEQALTLLEETADRFDVVMIDLRLPGLTGAETCRRVRALDPGVAIVVMSGLDLAGARRELDGIEVDQILTKPFRMTQMVEAIERAIGDRNP